MEPIFEKHGVIQKDYFTHFRLSSYQFPLHFHRAYEFIYVHDGKLSVRVDEREYEVTSGDLVIIFPNQLHEFRTIGHSLITVILFAPEWIGDFYMDYKGFVPEDHVLKTKAEPDLESLDTKYARKSFLYGVCAELVRRKSFTEVRYSPQTKILYKILLYVEEHYTSPCTLKVMSQQLQYDYYYLSKLFIRLMKMSFTDYLNRYRISQACYLLKNSNQTIGEVASQCGYNNLRSFHRNFRIITHLSPTEYRASRN